MGSPEEVAAQPVIQESFLEEGTSVLMSEG